MIETICLSLALVCGLSLRQIGLPPMIGYLVAGFALTALGPRIGLPEETRPVLEHLSHLGVMLLLFAVGLKLKLGQIVQPQVLGGGLTHAALTTALLSPVITFSLGLDWSTAILLAIALSFSSTVFAAKTLETKRDLGTFYGRTAIGILIVQDLIALAVLLVWGGEVPSPWAVLLLTLPLLRPVLHWLLDLAGHDELLVLAGLVVALVLGGAAFEGLGLSSELGALAMGVLLSTHRKAGELSDALWSMRELFLVAFFLQIGLSGLPGWHDLIVAAGLVVLLPLKAGLFFLLFVRFGLSARTAFLSALSLATYSEFALIVAARLLPEWLVPLALAVSLSFLIAAPLDRLAQRLFERFEARLCRFEPARLHRDDQPAALGGATVLVLGMGRTGTAAYDQLAETCPTIAGLDADSYRAAAHRAEGRNVLMADVEDAGFWRALDLGPLTAVLLAMDGIEAKVYAARALRAKGFAGPIVGHALFQDELPRLREAGATHTYLTMAQAGVALADQTTRALAEA
ncbi:cation:proton antiporter [Tabrizicola aquatica]|uniref:cation:proton antiporter domain-containing protein n=1 Tax=Tabrizicola aquatica TaxID=909926 RepID=UPI000CD2A9CE|nr:cation:proton antiporter [Tabrizicola aquatica]